MALVITVYVKIVGRSTANWIHSSAEKRHLSTYMTRFSISISASTGLKPRATSYDVEESTISDLQRLQMVNRGVVGTSAIETEGQLKVTSQGRW